MQQPQLNIDLSKTQPVLTPNGKQIWMPGYILRKVSKFITGTSEDAIIPIQVFYDPESGEISREGLENLKFMFDDEEKASE